jgi:gamma type small acid-soluble spore protein
VRAQNAQSRNAGTAAARSAAGAAGQFQNEFASESATNTQQVRAQNAQSQNKKNQNTSK